MMIGSSVATSKVAMMAEIVGEKAHVSHASTAPWVCLPAAMMVEILSDEVRKREVNFDRRKW
jgi:hypothetical protein